MPGLADSSRVRNATTVVDCVVEPAGVYPIMTAVRAEYSTRG